MFAALVQQELHELHCTDVVESAGYLESAKGQPAAAEWLELKLYTGIDLAGHQSRWIGDLNLGQFNVILCLEQAAQHEVIQALAQQKVNKPELQVLLVSRNGVENPWQQGLDAYKRSYNTMKKIVPRIVERL
jgi:protein-tyrosine-phosphatase